MKVEGKQRKTRKDLDMKIKQIWEDCCPFNPCGQGGILFDDETGLIDYHEQDCCEHVYADFSNLDSGILNHEFKNINLQEVKEGFRFGDTRKYFVPCYNEQNGYYSDYLEICYGKVVRVIDRYKKGVPHYSYTLIPIEKIEGCDYTSDIY
jgi:hypothetical protein